jgi:hypothetical protein
METIVFAVPIEVAHAARKRLTQKNVKKGFARCLTPMDPVVVMSNQPAPDKTLLAIRISRALKVRLERLAAQRKETVTDVVIAILGKSVQNVELTPDDYRKIADEIEAARSGRKTDQRLRPRRTEGGSRA